ncbi:TetR/AcrR family transcriptional regulator, partial [Paraburkholderia sp. SIMBA_027]
MLSEKEYDSITTKEVAARAGIGEATLFRYVVNKKNLFLLIYEEFFNDVLQACLDEDAKHTAENGTAEYYIETITRMYTSLAGL